MTDDDKINPASLYYLGSGDQPGNLITHVIFTGDNYATWARTITLALSKEVCFCRWNHHQTYGEEEDFRLGNCLLYVGFLAFT